MSQTFLAFDLGAETGRAILGQLDSRGRLEIKEIHRFPNGIANVLGNLHWDVLRLYRETVTALEICATHHGTRPASIGVDTWGLDFALLDERGHLLGNPFAYRDPRTDGIMEEVFQHVSRERMYELTGIQLMPMNTVFQLYAMVRDGSPQLEVARDLLFIPDLLNYFLTGTKKSEYTFATTSQLLSPGTRTWQKEIFQRLGIPLSLMQEIVDPGTLLGELTEPLGKHTGLGPVPVIAVASHDTASAVAAVPASGEDIAYISSGTWSLVGIESPEPIINQKSLTHNFTNEGGVGNRVRFLKNVMGLWLLQECRRAWAREQDHSYEQLVQEAEHAPHFRSLIDPDCLDFLTPPDMTRAIADFCTCTSQPVPETRGQYVRCVLESLAFAYRRTLDQVQDVTDRRAERIHIIGGGTNNALLCQMTAHACGVPVYAGPSEATAVGNLLVQAMAFGRISSLEELRQVVRDSFGMAVYEPQECSEWEEPFARFLELTHN